MNAVDVMTRSVVSIGPDAPIRDAIRLMLDHRISGLPVVDGTGKLVGVLTEGDLLRRTETGTERHRPRWLELLQGPGRLAEDYVRTHGRKVGEVMTDTVVTASEDDSLAEIVRLMERHRVKRLPVQCGNTLVGIITRADLVRTLGALLDNETAGASTSKDAATRQNVLAALQKTAWAPRAGVGIAVMDGVVTFAGAITDDRHRGALRVLAENVPGVTGVRDRLLWVEPLSGTVIGGPTDDAPSTASRNV